MIAPLFWLALATLHALTQAGAVRALREYVPPDSPEAKQADRGLHVWGTVAYLLPMWLFGPPGAPWVVLARLLVFSPVLNLASGKPAWYVGETARTDRALRWLASRLRWPAERLKLALWLLACGLAAGWALHEK